MCPLIAHKGSPWMEDKADTDCPEDANICPWWDIACSTGGIQGLVDRAIAGHPVPVVGPNKPNRYTADPSKARFYSCELASTCSWQKQAALHGQVLCPPRNALLKGFDPRICLF
jgi:hypothetical protein